MKVENTEHIKPEGNIVMILYGRGGVGKTTFAATADKPLIIDFENGSKFLGERGLSCDVIRMADWITYYLQLELLLIWLSRGKIWNISNRMTKIACQLSSLLDVVSAAMDWQQNIGLENL